MLIRSFIAVLVSLTLAGPALASSASVVGPVVPVSGPSPFASCAVGADATAGNHVNASVEPQVAVNPITIGTQAVNLIAVWQQDRWDDGGAHGIAAAASFDGGASWTETTLPFTRCSANGLPFDRASDPWVSFGPDGTAYASALVDTMSTQGPQLAGIVTAVSRDGGKTWTHLQRIDSGEDDKPSITADPTKAGVAYAVWDRADTGIFVRTADGGVTWSKPKVIVGGTARPLSTTGHQIVVDRKRHALDDVFGVYGTKAVHKMVCHKASSGKKTCHTTVRLVPGKSYLLALVRSTNGGKKWSSPIPIAEDRSVGLVGHVGLDLRSGEGIPEIAVDSAGRMYVDWPDGRFSHEQYDAVAVSASTDGGKHWKKPVAAPVPTAEQAAVPSIGVDRHGDVGVAFYGVPRAVTPGQVPSVDYRFALSRDHGAHFGTPVVVAGPFSLSGARVAAGAYFLGDYEGLAVGGDFYAVLAAADGTVRGPIDVLFARVHPGMGAGARRRSRERSLRQKKRSPHVVAVYYDFVIPVPLQ